MTREEAERYAENMTYREAIGNLFHAKGIPYRKATFIKANELLKMLEQEPTTKNNLAHNLCNSCTNIGCEFQSGIVRTNCAFYMPPHIEPDNCGNYVVQDSTTKNDLGVDCISRKQAIDAFPNLLPNMGYNKKAITEILQELPPVTPIRPKGHWIEQNDDYFDWYECSECGYGSEGEMQYSSEVDVRTNFCPYCGTKMEVEDGNNNH